MLGQPPFRQRAGPSISTCDTLAEDEMLAPTPATTAAYSVVKLSHSEDDRQSEIYFDSR